MRGKARQAVKGFLGFGVQNIESPEFSEPFRFVVRNRGSDRVHSGFSSLNLMVAP